MPGLWLTQGLHRAVSLSPDREATCFGERRGTYRQLRERVARLAAALVRLGVKPGDRVGMLALNSDRYLEYYLGVFWAGAAVNPVNTRWSVAEIAYSLRDCDTRILIVDARHRGLVQELRSQAPCLEHCLYFDDGDAPAGTQSLERLMATSAPARDAGRGGQDLAGVFYTGGTTGFPKGVMLHHDGIASAVLCRLGLGFVPGPAYLHAAPLFHLAGATGIFAQLMNAGRHVILPGFDPGAVLRAITQERVSDCLLVPTMIQSLVDHPDGLDGYDLSSLQMIVYGAAPISEALLERVMKLLPGVSFMQGYGMTELSGPVVFLPPEQHLPENRSSGRLRSAGRPAPLAEIRIVDGNGEEVPREVIGEILLRGPSAMIAYWNRPEDTAATIRGGWIHSGDAGYMDAEGYLFIVDRVKDMIVSGGENVYSAEVENALSSHADVASCAVIGIPHEHWGESVHAVVVIKSGGIVTADELIAYCKTRIAGYKCPRSVDFRFELPLTGAGKIMKAKLREPYWLSYDRRIN